MKLKLHFRLVAVVLAVAIVASAAAMAVTVEWLGGDSSRAMGTAAAAEAPRAREVPSDPHDQYALDPAFTVNLSQGDAFLRVGIVLACSNAKVVAALKVRDAEVRDRVISVLRAQSLPDLRRPAGEDAVKKELLNAINPLLVGEGRVVDVYFTEFIVD